MSTSTNYGGNLFDRNLHFIRISRRRYQFTKVVKGQLYSERVCRFEETEPPGARSFFTEIIASISDIKFARGGRYILSRDYMTLKVSLILMHA